MPGSHVEGKHRLGVDFSKLLVRVVVCDEDREVCAGSRHGHGRMMVDTDAGPKLVPGLEEDGGAVGRWRGQAVRRAREVWAEGKKSNLKEINISDSKKKGRKYKSTWVNAVFWRHEDKMIP